MEYSVTVKGAELPVAVSLKKMKQVRLKVFPSGEIKLSAPIGTPESFIKTRTAIDAKRKMVIKNCLCGEGFSSLISS